MKRAHASGKRGPAFAPFGALRGPKASEKSRESSAAELVRLIDAGVYSALILDSRKDPVAVRARELRAARGSGT